MPMIRVPGRRRAADHEHAWKAFAQEEAGQHADQDWCELNEHRSGAGIDMLLASIQRNAVYREPGDADHGGERPFPGVHADQLAADHHHTQRQTPNEQPAEAERTRMDVVGGVPNDHEG